MRVPGLLDALTSGPALAAQLDQLTALTAELAATLASLDAASSRATSVPNRVPVEIALASDGRVTWNDSRQLLVVRALCGAAGSARFALQIGTDTSRRFRVATTALEVVHPRSPVLIPRGVDITLTQLGGGALQWDLWLWAIPVDTPFAAVPRG